MVWDVAGQNNFRPKESKGIYKSADGVILMYSIEDRKSFENLSIWLQELKVNLGINKSWILVATKADSEVRQVSYDEGKSFAEAYGLKFFETSSKVNINITEAMMTIAMLVNKTRKLRDCIDEKIILENQRAKKKKICEN